MSHTNTRKWVAPHITAAEQNRQLQQRNDSIQRNVSKLQQKFCPKSCAWTKDMNLAQHKREFDADEVLRRQLQINRAMKSGLVSATIRSPSITLPLGGKSFSDNMSAVLSQPTVFTPHFELGRIHPVCPWPTFPESKYEGDERIRTDMLHGRFLGAPRVPANETVNWQHRTMVPQYALENYHYPIPTENDILMRNWYIPQLELGDEEGRWMVGEDLMDILEE